MAAEPHPVSSQTAISPEASTSSHHLLHPQEAEHGPSPHSVEVNVHAEKTEANADDEIDVDDEEPGECPFCLFMKAGPCRDNFIQWEECVQKAEEAKEDIVEKCHQITFLLKECMEANADYYEPVLQAEKAMEEAAQEEQTVAAAATASQQEQSSVPDAPLPQEGPTNLGERGSADETHPTISKTDGISNLEAQPHAEQFKHTYHEVSEASEDGIGSSITEKVQHSHQ